MWRGEIAKRVEVDAAASAKTKDNEINRHILSRLGGDGMDLFSLSLLLDDAQRYGWHRCFAKSEPSRVPQT